MSERLRNAIDSTGLIGIVAIGTVVSQNRIEIELHSLELRAGGAYVNIRVFDGRPGRASAFDPTEFDLSSPRLTITDGDGSYYETILVNVDGTNPAVWRFRFAVVPGLTTDFAGVEVSEFEGANLAPPWDFGKVPIETAGE